MSTHYWIALVGAVVAIGCGSPSKQLPSYPLERARLAPVDLQLSSFPSGTAASLEPYRGKIVLLDVWASWCAPCRESLPRLQSLADRYADRGVVVLTVSLDEDEAQLRAFLGELSLDLPVWRDPGAEGVAQALPFSAAPTSYILDRHGRVRAIHTGVSDVTIHQQQATIEHLLQARHSSGHRPGEGG